MRISNVQNFALNAVNAIDKCCRPRKANENNSAHNSLERSPMQDTVSFGSFDEKYYDFVSECMLHNLRKGKNRDNFMRLMDNVEDSQYVRLMPTKDTLLDPKRGKCKLRLVSFKEMRPYASDEKVKYSDDIMRNHIKDFNKIHELEDDWEQELKTPEDFEMAAELARYLDNHGYFPKDSCGSDDVDVFNFYDKGLSF